MNNIKYENLCNDWCHSCIGQLHKSHWTLPRCQSFICEVAASHLVFLEVNFKSPASHMF